MRGYRDLQKVWEGPFWEGFWPCLEPWGSVRLHAASTYWNVPGKDGPHGELFFFLTKKEPEVASDDEATNPFFSAETLKACALIDPHLWAADGGVGTGGRQSSGYPTSPEWFSLCSASETSVGREVYEHNNECRAIEVIRQDWSSEVVALFLEDWELGRVGIEPHDHGPSLPRSEGCKLGQLRVAGFSLVNCHSKQASHRGRVVTTKERRNVSDKPC